ncbi:acyl-CoA desaturase [Amycolatopsis sp. DG1A-15b]|uniref:acyl-CoA desaturase n=1 Tax=Amycolatopsis sp. DG1A-15b TaxID=3052846 RepID=UPI00255B801C|nr:acyl-CoA desaturase [Amycolatopsis sp. DG1A-15b]WIX92071.1 acyl-CoA desaturase [Amycolatopsis sp. DG1A-15b]
MLAGEKSRTETFLVKLFAVVPLLALASAVPFAWGWGLGWTDVALTVGFYFLTGLGVTIGFHRYFTHGAFKAHRGLRIALAVAGSMAMQGPVIGWVADHRRHHAYADRDGDPHSPWRYGTSAAALAKGFWHAHMGWLFDREKTNARRFAPDLLADRDIVRIDRWFPALTVLTLLAPALIGGLVTLSWWGALTAFFWASLVRVAVLHHVTWSVNSLCHMIGERPYAARDKSANFWPLAIASMGESWHNSHHADPTCARHGVRRGQLDMSARLIRLFEKLGWATDVRWPRPEHLARKLNPGYAPAPRGFGKPVR